MKDYDERLGRTSLNAQDAPSWTDLERLRYQRRLVAASRAAVAELQRKQRGDGQDLLRERAYLAAFRRELKRLETNLSEAQAFDCQCSAPRDV